MKLPSIPPDDFDLFELDRNGLRKEARIDSRNLNLFRNVNEGRLLVPPALSLALMLAIKARVSLSGKVTSVASLRTWKQMCVGLIFVLSNFAVKNHTAGLVKCKKGTRILPKKS